MKVVWEWLSSVQSGSHSNLPEFLKVKLHHSVHKHLRIHSSVPFGNVHDVGFQHNGVNLTVPVELVHGRHGAVVMEPVLAADHAEAEQVVVVVENLEALGAGGRREARNDGDLPDAADAAVAWAHVAALDEVLVLLRIIEASNQGPHRVRRSLDTLRYDRGADFGGWRELVVRVDGCLQFREFL